MERWTLNVAQYTIRRTTKPTNASVEAYIASRANEEQKADCKLTKHPRKMWGPSIVGYGCHRYTHESGRSGEMPLAAFAIRGRQRVVYLDAEGAEQRALLSRLGKHQMGRSCLYFKRLGDIDQSVLEQLVVGSIAQVKSKHG